MITFNPREILSIRDPKNPQFHFSVDDVFDSLIEVTDKKIPLFEHPVFSFLQDMHKRFGIPVDLYLFFQKEIDGKFRTLSEVRDVRKELAAAGGWIYFGPHALDYHTMPYDQTAKEQCALFDRIYREIDRFAGAGQYADLVRLHFYSELYERADYFAKRGVLGLLSTDREVGSYRMPTEIGAELYRMGSATYERMHFIRTQFRLEFFVRDHFDAVAIEHAFRRSLSQYGYVVLYTHEIEFADPRIRSMLLTSLEVLHRISSI